MIAPTFAHAARPAPRDPGDASDPTDAIHLDLARTAVFAVAGTLARLLRGTAAWADGAGPVRVQVEGQLECDELRDASACLQCLLRNPTSPALRGEIAFECRQMVHPLERHGGLWTATAFAEAACLLQPREPWHAVEVARLATLRDLPDVAWAWYLWAARLAREENEPGALCAVALETGLLARFQDRHALAARLLALGARYARRHGRGDFEGDTLCELGTLRHELGHMAEALTHFGAALRAYGPGNGCLLELGYRMGTCWLEEGQYQAAMHVLLPLTPRTTGPRLTAVTAALARACAAVGWVWNYESAWNATWESLHHASRCGQAAALLQLRRAAVIRRDWTRAKSAAVSALCLVVKDGCAELVEEAERLGEVLTLPRRKRTRAVIEAAFPDVARMRLHLGACWDENEQPEPWQASYALRTLVNAFTEAVRPCPPVVGRVGAQ